MTPTARLLIRQMGSEAAHWDDVAKALVGDPDKAIAREKAASRRDAIDWAMQQLRTALPAIEEEAGDAAIAESLRLDAVLASVPGCGSEDMPVLRLDTDRGFVEVPMG